MFINPTTITTATLLRALAGAKGATVTKSALRQHWAQQFAHPNQIPPLPHTANAPTTRQIKKALDALSKLGAIHHTRHHITTTDHAILVRIANLA